MCLTRKMRTKGLFTLSKYTPTIINRMKWNIKAIKKVMGNEKGNRNYLINLMQYN